MLRGLDARSDASGRPTCCGRTPGRTDRRIAGLVGCDHKTIAAAPRGLAARGEIPHLTGRRRRGRQALPAGPRGAPPRPVAGPTPERGRLSGRVGGRRPSVRHGLRRPALAVRQRRHRRGRRGPLPDDDAGGNPRPARRGGWLPAPPTCTCGRRWPTCPTPSAWSRRGASNTGAYLSGCKPRSRLGNYWAFRDGVPVAGRARRLSVPLDGILNHLCARRGPHSEKPESVRRLVQGVSPGPRLELFGRRSSPAGRCSAIRIEGAEGRDAA